MSVDIHLGKRVCSHFVIDHSLQTDETVRSHTSVHSHPLFTADAAVVSCVTSHYSSSSIHVGERVVHKTIDCSIRTRKAKFASLDPIVILTFGHIRRVFEGTYNSRSESS